MEDEERDLVPAPGEDHDGRLEVVLGLAELELRGRLLAELFLPADRQAVDQALREGAERGHCGFEAHLLAADGTAVQYHWTGARLRDEEGHVTGLTGVGRDITERKQAEEALRQHEEQVRQLQKMEAIGQLAGGIAHDFNNLLMVIKGRAELLLRRVPDGDSTGSALAAIEQAADRETALIRQLLVFSRTQVLQRLELNGVVSDMAGMLRDLLVTDVVMPQMNGVELAKHLRTVRPNVRALYVSGYLIDASVREHLLQDGAQFLQKPFAAGDLTRKVGEALGSP